MKKTCNDCRALSPALTERGYRCSLGYKIDEKYHPLEECPKPKTISSFINCKNKNWNKKE